MQVPRSESGPQSTIFSRQRRCRFDMRDLKEAKALLEESARVRPPLGEHLDVKSHKL
jgi:hypothetical protein